MVSGFDNHSQSDVPVSAPAAANGTAGVGARQPILEARGIVKTYGHVEALRGANLTAYAGEVVALIGDNGAGKSTLIKVLSGVARPDCGEIRFEGRAVQLVSPAAAQQLGIETVYQDLALAADLDSAANVFLGRELTRPGVLGRLGVLDKLAMQEKAAQAFSGLGVGIRDPGAAVGNLSGGQRQGVAIARAAAWASKVIIMDEPTAALGVVQRARVLDVVRQVSARGLAVILISHSMPDVLEVADRIEVLRLGQRVATFTRHDATLEGLVGAMTGAVRHEEMSA
jgi:simple sugar transport system ATP-binding protein